MYLITGLITNQNNVEALDTLEFLRDNYPTKVTSASVNGDNLNVYFNLSEIDFTAAVAIMTNLIQTYAARFQSWKFNYKLE